MSNLSNLLQRLAQDETGAVTVDWVALTAALVLVGLVIGGAIMNATDGLAQLIVDALEDVTADGILTN